MLEHFLLLVYVGKSAQDSGEATLEHLEQLFRRTLKSHAPQGPCTNA